MSAQFGGGRFSRADVFESSVWPMLAGDQISIGDFLYWDSGNSAVRPLSKRTGSATQVADQATVAPIFVGVAMEGRLAAQTGAGYAGYPLTGIQVATDVVYEADCAAATFGGGDPVGIVSAATSSAGDISDQAVVEVAVPAVGIGFAVAVHTANTTKIRCRLHGRHTFGRGDQAYFGIGGRQGAGTTTLSDADTTLTAASNPILVGVPTAARKVILPPPAQCKGFMFWVVNNSGGSFNLNVRDNGDTTTIQGVAQNKRGVFWCDGATWYGLLGA